MLNEKRISNKAALSRTAMTIAGFLLLLLLAGCSPGSEAAGAAAGEAESTEPPSNSAAEDVSQEGSAEPAAAENEPLRIENHNGAPFYARFGEDEFFSDGEKVVIIFYRQPDCIPADFNMNEFFHFPGEESPGAFACAPPTITSVETWQKSPETDPAPLVAETTGLGAVPVWFFAAAEVETAMADGVVTIDELAALPSRQVGTASTYTELLHPSQSNETSLVQFAAEGSLEDGADFSVDVSQGDPDVDDHVTIDLPG
jgi:hypothetical protein